MQVSITLRVKQVEIYFCYLRASYELSKTQYNLGLHFWDYGNAFLLEARRAGADVTKKTADGKEIESGIEFRYDSYVQKIMG